MTSQPATDPGPNVLVTESAGVQIVTINRPHVRNAINHATAVDIAAAMDELDARDDLIAGVITGKGTSFCAGMDLKAFLEGERPSTPERGFAGIVAKPPVKPLIAAVNGPAIAGGFEIVLACDLIVAADDAVFGLPEVKRGLVAAGGGLLRLPRRIPYHLAMEWALTGEYVTAQRAYEVALVNRLVPVDTVLAEATALAASIAANGPLALRATKRIIVESRNWDSDNEFIMQAEISEPVRASDDAKEGARAFKEKRPPVWQGR
ncbi:MAG TPA: crotonase/enoyl-CoA hydratase family protein [Acidothermaceae bacterium]|jgi:enoyl-CoA hydratase|nr:crotonase/enoyl-CoA hydratase family protein [Acidothermaceae bacterium]